jgi:PQQ-like domain
MAVPRWEVPNNARPIALAASADGGFALLTEDSSFLLVGADGRRIEQTSLDAKPARERTRARTETAQVAGAAFGMQDTGARGWLVGSTASTHLLRISAGKSSPFGDGASEVAAFRASGEQVAIARAGSVDLWNQAGQRRWQHDGGPFVALTIARNLVVALSADGELVFLSMLSGSVAGRLKLEVPEPAHTWHLAHLEGARFALALSEWLVIVDAAKEKVFRRTRLRSKASALATTERRAILGLEDGWVQTVDALTGEIRSAIQVHDAPIRALAVAGGLLVSAAARGPLRAWDEALIYGSQTTVAQITAIAARGEMLALGEKNGRVRALRCAEELFSMRLDASVAAVQIGKDDSVTAVSQSLVVRWERPWKTPKPLVLDAPCTAFAADETYLFSGNERGSVDVFPRTGAQKKLTRYELSGAPITALLRPRGNYLVVGTHALDGRLLVIDLSEGQILHRLEPHQEAFGITCLAAEPRGRMLASGAEDGTIALVEIAKGRVLATLRTPETPISLAFDPTGKRLFAVLADGIVMRFALDQKAAAATVAVPLATCAFSSEGSVVLGLRNGRTEALAGDCG